jgi:hypothetical protein
MFTKGHPQRSCAGHVLPGVLLIIWGSWWAYNICLRYLASRQVGWLQTHAMHSMITIPRLLGSRAETFPGLGGPQTSLVCSLCTTVVLLQARGALPGRFLVPAGLKVAEVPRAGPQGPPATPGCLH